MIDSQAPRPADHLPTPEEFSAAFGVGGDPHSIHAIDACGVTLAAVQGLHEQVQELDSEICALREGLAQARVELADARQRRKNQG